MGMMRHVPALLLALVILPGLTWDDGARTMEHGLAGWQNTTHDFELENGRLKVREIICGQIGDPCVIFSQRAGPDGAGETDQPDANPPGTGVANWAARTWGCRWGAGPPSAQCGPGGGDWSYDIAGVGVIVRDWPTSYKMAPGEIWFYARNHDEQTYTLMRLDGAGGGPGEPRVWLWAEGKGLVPLQVDDPNSCGAGYRCLRTPN